MPYILVALLLLITSCKPAMFKDPSNELPTPEKIRKRAKSIHVGMRAEKVLKRLGLPSSMPPEPGSYWMYQLGPTNRLILTFSTNNWTLVSADFEYFTTGKILGKESLVSSVTSTNKPTPTNN